jgi:glutamate N-acetyltransferase/amino-acid N-acetyltransferase
VQVDRGLLPGSGFRAVVGNSRCANACTGEQGIKDAAEMAALAAQIAGGSAGQGLVMSTGVIGTMLPMEKIRSGIRLAAETLDNTEEAFHRAARGIMTTDTVEKYVTKSLVFADGTEIRLAGICKGAAMIAPRLAHASGVAAKQATLLAVVFTDANIAPETLHRLIGETADASFNCITVDGHTSTSDTLLLLANGAAQSSPASSTDTELFRRALGELCTELAVKIPADGEGASHLITLDVQGCRTLDDAKTIARKIAEDALVKAAICGADPNWGRIVSASGTAGVPYNPKGVSLQLNGVTLFDKGEPVPFDKASVSASIRNHRDTSIVLSLSEGTESVRFWTTDLTEEYVRLNSDYTT